MPQKFRASVMLLVSLFAVVSFSGCAARSYLKVDYQVPNAAQDLKGQVVHLRVIDQRSAASILTASAADQFPEFSGIFSLAWIMPDQQRILAGEHHLQELFKAVFEKRLTELGGGTTDSTDAGTPVLTIVLKQLTIDLKKHKWTADMNFDAVLSLEGSPTAKESIRGSAERLQILGIKGADTMFGEIFSDSVNRLDLIRLFRNARLIP
jgi:uncharacterized lipoprotein YajG